jgi:ketosteroid isomerase-like protein
MPEESTTPDLVELVRGAYEASNRRDFDAMMSVYGHDSVWDMTPMGLGTYEGLAVIRRFFEDWVGTFEEFEVLPDEISVWVESVAVRTTNYTDIDEARATAQRLAEERG